MQYSVVHPLYEACMVSGRVTEYYTTPTYVRARAQKLSSDHLPIKSNHNININQQQLNTNIQFKEEFNFINGS